MADISVQWGDDTLTIPLPSSWTVRQTAIPTIAPASDDWPERLARALTRPEAMPPLGEILSKNPQARIAIIVEDVTRYSPLPKILEIIFREIRYAGIQNENIEIIFATGMHRPLTDNEAIQKIGQFAQQIRWRCNPWKDRNAYVHLGMVEDTGYRMEVLMDRGVVEADLRIIISSVSPHLQAGFGGGYKMLIPGCAHLETIRRLHLSNIPRRARQQVGQNSNNNRMRRLIDKAGKLVDSIHGISFSIQYILDMKGDISQVATGDVITCHRMLAKRCSATCGIVLDAPGDIVITSAYPRDFDLWQSFKCIANTCWAAREDGVIICLSRCPGGVNMPMVSSPISPKRIRQIVRLIGANALSSIIMRLVPSISSDAVFFLRIALQILQRNTIMMVSPTLAKADAKIPGLYLFNSPADAIAAAEALLGKGDKRTIVFPAGGISYPVLSKQTR